MRSRKLGLMRGSTTTTSAAHTPRHAMTLNTATSSEHHHGAETANKVKTSGG